MTKEPNFIALLKYKTTEAGGRKTHAVSGYRPTIRFPFSKMLTSEQQISLDKEKVYPGDIIKTFIKIVSIEFFQYSLSEGMEFEFTEGLRIVGTGIILSILNPILVKVS